MRLNAKQESQVRVSRLAFLQTRMKLRDAQTCQSCIHNGMHENGRPFMQCPLQQQMLKYLDRIVAKELPFYSPLFAVVRCQFSR